MKPSGRPPGSALERGMRFARWALARPRPPSVEDVMRHFGLPRAQARAWRNHWLRSGPHFPTTTENPS